jgi:hypothetical protein
LNTGLQLKIFDLNISIFKPAKNEIHFFGIGGFRHIVIETNGYNHEDEQLLLSQITGYLRSLRFQQIQLIRGAQFNTTKRSFH